MSSTCRACESGYDEPHTCECNDCAEKDKRIKELEAQLAAEQTQSMRLLNQAGRYSAKLDAVRPYIQHDPMCGKDRDPSLRCICGLQAIQAAIGEGET